MFRTNPVMVHFQQQLIQDCLFDIGYNLGCAKLKQVQMPTIQHVDLPGPGCLRTFINIRI